MIDAIVSFEAISFMDGRFTSNKLSLYENIFTKGKKLTIWTNIV